MLTLNFLNFLCCDLKLDLLSSHFWGIFMPLWYHPPPWELTRGLAAQGQRMGPYHSSTGSVEFFSRAVRWTLGTKTSGSIITGTENFLTLSWSYLIPYLLRLQGGQPLYSFLCVKEIGFMLRRLVNANYNCEPVSTMMLTSPSTHLGA